MPELRSIQNENDWFELTVTDEDWNEADPNLLLNMLFQLKTIRAFEEVVLELASEGLVHGPAHSSIGQEGGAVGSALALGGKDAVNGSHRGHHQFLAKAINYVSDGAFDPNQPVTAGVQEVLTKTLAEILGLANGYCAGRGGSMHLQWLEAGALGTNAIVGGGVPGAAGHAWNQKLAESKNVVFSYFGDGAINIGSVLETMNLASAWKLPMGFFVENNRYAVSTSIEDVTADSRVSIRGQGFSMPSWRVDGMNPLAVYLASQQLVEKMRNGGGPGLIEADVYRYFHQNGPFPGSAFGYRTKDEEKSWRERDPILLMERKLRERGILTDDYSEFLNTCVSEAIGISVAELTEPDSDQAGRRQIKPSLYPDPSFVDVGIRGDASEFSGLQELDSIAASAPKVQKKYVEVAAETLVNAMRNDERIVVLGEDVHRLGGGVYGTFKGISEEFPERLFGTPISENAFIGLAGGSAQEGTYRPVVELMYPDFVWVAADQAFNQIGRARHMFGGENPVPMVMKTSIQMGTGYGSQHLMDPAGLFAMSPGWRIVAPSSASDYVGLLNAALVCEDPVLVIEHADLYGQTFEVFENELDYVLKPGTAALRREGNEATVISYLNMVNLCVEVADEGNFDVDIVDLRWLDRASIDWEMIETSVKKTNSVVIVEQGSSSTSYGGWLADEIQRRLFDWLDAPVLRVTGGEAAPSISRTLEEAAIAGKDEILTAFEALRVERGTR